MVDMRRQLDDLQRQLGTGKASDTYAGLGLNRGLAVGLRTHLASLGGFGDAITKSACASISRRPRSAASARSRTTSNRRPCNPADRSFQRPDRPGPKLTAYSELGEILGLLNTRVGTATCSPAAPATSLRSRASTAS